MGARLAGIGTSLPEKVLTNDDLAQMMDTSDEWIRERTGIRERRIGLPTSSLGIESGRAAIDMAGLDPPVPQVLPRILRDSRPVVRGRVSKTEDRGIDGG